MRRTKKWWFLPPQADGGGWVGVWMTSSYTYYLFGSPFISYFFGISKIPEEFLKCLLLDAKRRSAGPQQDFNGLMDLPPHVSIDGMVGETDCCSVAASR
jgi:hypothetical protein